MSTTTRNRSTWKLSLPEGLAGLAALTAAFASIAGFIPGLYRDRPVVIPQSHGYDVGNLIAATVLVLGLVWSARGSVRGRLVAIGALGCLAYSYVTYAFVIVLNPVTLLYVAVLSLAAWSIVTGLLRVDGEQLEQRADAPVLRRATGVFMIALVVIFAVNWLRQIGAAVIGGHLPADLAANGWPMNPVWVLDLGFALPLTALGGVWLLQRRPGAVLIAVAVLTFMLLLSATILSMAAGMTLAGETLDLALVGIFGSVAVISAILVLAWLWRAPTTRADAADFGIVSAATGS